MILKSILPIKRKGFKDAGMLRNAQESVRRHGGYQAANSDHRAYKTAIARTLKEQLDIGSADAVEEAQAMMESTVSFEQLANKYGTT